jgi:hypothetical protein
MRRVPFGCQRADADLAATSIVSWRVKKNTSRRNPHTKPGRSPISANLTPGGGPTIFRKAVWMVSGLPTLRDLSLFGGGPVASVSLYKARRIRELQAVTCCQLHWEKRARVLHHADLQSSGPDPCRLEVLLITGLAR